MDVQKQTQESPVLGQVQPLGRTAYTVACGVACGLGVQASPFKPLAFVDAWNIHDPMVRPPARPPARVRGRPGVRARSDARRLAFPSAWIGMRKRGA